MDDTARAFDSPSHRVVSVGTALTSSSVAESKTKKNGGYLHERFKA